MKTAAFVLLIVLLAAQPAAGESPLLASARRLASQLEPAVQPADPAACGAAAERGAFTAERRQGRLGWILGSLAVPIVMPVIAHTAQPGIPVDVLADVGSSDLDCFREGYQSAAKRKRALGAWIGTAFTVTALAVLAAVGEGHHHHQHHH